MTKNPLVILHRAQHLFNFPVGQAKTAIYLSRKNKLEDLFDVDATLNFKCKLRARLKTDFSLFSLANNVEEFKKMWCLKKLTFYFLFPVIPEHLIQENLIKQTNTWVKN